MDVDMLDTRVLVLIETASSQWEQYGDYPSDDHDKRIEQDLRRAAAAQRLSKTLTIDHPDEVRSREDTTFDMHHFLL